MCLSQNLSSFQSKTITRRKKETFGQMTHLHLCLKFGTISSVYRQYFNNTLIIYSDRHVYYNYTVCRKTKALTDCTINQIKIHFKSPMQVGLAIGGFIYDYITS